MQEFISTVSVLLGVLVFFPAVVAFFKPLPQVWLGTKRNAALALIFSVSSCSVGTTLAPDSMKEPAKPKVAEVIAPPKAAEASEPLPPARPYPSQTNAPPRAVTRHVEKAIAAWDLLERCRRKPRFKYDGTADGGPCGNWTFVMKEMTNSDIDKEVLRYGFECNGDEVWSAGIAHTVLETDAFSAGPEHRQSASRTIVSVRKKVAACRAKLAPFLPQAEVTKAQMGAEWPLTVRAGKVGCDYNGAAWFQPAGGAKRYGLNSDAYGKYPKIEPIWAQGNDGLRRDITALAEKAQNHCYVPE